MKNLILLNRSGMGPDGMSRKGRYSLDPILSRFSLVSLFCVLMLTVSVGNAWGGYTITFTTGSGDGTSMSTSTAASTCISSGGSYVTGNLAAASNVYHSGANGLKLGKSSGAGNIKLTLSASGQVSATNIIVYARRYNSNAATIQVNGKTGQSVTNNSGWTAYTFAINANITYIQLQSNKYLWVQSVEVVTSEPKYTLKVSDGTGGYTTYSNKVKSDLTKATAMGGNSCTDGLQGAYSGWRTSSLETPAGSPGTTYSHATAGAMPATGSTLYAVYYSYGEGGYLTNTLCEETCSNTVTPAAGTKTNVTTIAFDKASVETCSETASDRQVTVTITPASCYAVPSSTRLTVSGATYVSGPTDNGNGTYSFVYEFAQNATGTKTFNASLSTTATYTVSYAKGNVPSGGGSISGSHADDTKTCGTSMTLPGVTFTTTGYTQTGWSKTNSGSQYAAVGGSYTDNAAQTFYPVWTANKYTVTWSVNGSTYQTTSNVSYNTTTSTPANPSVPVECTGSTFMGWTATQNYTGNSAPANMFNGTSPTITGDITFYAVFADED